MKFVPEASRAADRNVLSGSRQDGFSENFGRRLPDAPGTMRSAGACEGEDGPVETRTRRKRLSHHLKPLHEGVFVVEPDFVAAGGDGAAFYGGDDGGVRA